MKIIKISVLIPSVNGIKLLFSCIQSIFGTSSGDNEIEVIVKLDFDDDETIQKINILPYKDKIKIIISHKGLGYGEIHTFINDMAKLATGDWLQPLNDDTIMQTKNWDKYLEKFDKKIPQILCHLKFDKTILSKCRRAHIFEVERTRTFFANRFSQFINTIA